jgi:hypothetical protein
MKHGRSNERNRHMRALIGVLASLLLAGSVVAQQSTKPAPADLGLVVKALRDPATTDAKLAEFAGRQYAGAVVVRAVRFQPDGSALLDAEPVESAAEGGPLALLRFVARQEDEKIQQIRPAQTVRVTATLTKIGTWRLGRMAEFGDLTIESGK